MDFTNFTSARGEAWIRTGERLGDRSVFRCPPVQTLILEEKLNGMGYDVWTPVCWIHQRLPRKKGRIWKKVGIIPSFLFVRLDQTERVVDERVVGLRPAIDRGLIMAVSEEELSPLRETDNRDFDPEAFDRRPVKFVEGDAVEIDSEFVLTMFGETEGVVLEGTNSQGEVFVALKNSTKPLWFQGSLLKLIGVRS